MHITTTVGFRYVTIEIWIPNSCDVRCEISTPHPAVSLLRRHNIWVVLYYSINIYWHGAICSTNVGVLVCCPNTLRGNSPAPGRTPTHAYQHGMVAYFKYHFGLRRFAALDRSGPRSVTGQYNSQDNISDYPHPSVIYVI